MNVVLGVSDTWENEDLWTLEDAKGSVGNLWGLNKPRQGNY